MGACVERRGLPGLTKTEAGRAASGILVSNNRLNRHVTHHGTGQLSVPTGSRCFPGRRTSGFDVSRLSCPKVRSGIAVVFVNVVANGLPQLGNTMKDPRRMASPSEHERSVRPCSARKNWKGH